MSPFSVMPYALGLAKKHWYLWPVDRTHFFFKSYINFCFYSALIMTTVLHIILSIRLGWMLLFTFLHINKLKLTVLE